MKSILGLTVFLLIPSLANGGEVKRDYRRYGSYVVPAQETNPDGALDKNYSFRGNAGPDSSRIMPGEPVKRLDRDYQVSPKKEQSYSPLNPFVLRW